MKRVFPSVVCLFLASMLSALLPATASAGSKSKEVQGLSAPVGDIAYVLITFSDRPEPPRYSYEFARQQLLSQHAAFLNEVSYGRVGPNAKVFGWYRLSEPSTQFCGFTPRLQDAVIKAVDPDIDFRQYGIIEIIVDQRSGCGPSAAHPGSPNLTATKEGKKWLWYGFWGDPFPDAHEFGHDMSFAHAGLIDCGNVAINEDLSQCTDATYGDRFDPMGGGPGFTHYSIYRKHRLGFVRGDELTVVTRSGVYRMNPMESASSAVKGLRIMGSLGQTVLTSGWNTGSGSASTACSTRPISTARWCAFPTVFRAA
jgi:hypothetical protein